MEKPNWKIKYIFVCMILIIAFAIYGQTIPEREVVEQTIKIEEVVINIEVAKTKEELEKGLSGKESLPENSGMLFVFPIANKYTFWMPDMNFPIDIIWINNNKVVDITSNVTNIFDRSNPIYYSTEKPAKYVLEVNAGFSEKNNIKIGSMVEVN